MSPYANGADGLCQECGDPTDEEWHVYCSDCYRAEQGWGDESGTSTAYRDDPDKLRWQHEHRGRVTTARLAARVDELERRVSQLERRAA